MDTINYLYIKVINYFENKNSHMISKIIVGSISNILQNLLLLFFIIIIIVK